MNNITKASTQPSIKITKKNLKSFFKVLQFYGLSFVFWVNLFINNEGPGGVESQHLIIMGIVHAVLVCFHGLAVFNPEQ